MRALAMSVPHAARIAAGPLFLAALVLTTPCAGGASAQEQASSDRELLVQDTLGRLEQLAARARGVVRVLSGLTLDPDEPAAHALGALEPQEQEDVLALLAGIPHETLAVELSACATAARADGTTAGVLLVLGRFGCADELSLAARTAAAVLDGEQPPAGLDQQLRTAAVEILKRDEQAYRWLSSLILGVGGETAVTLVLATGDAGAPQGLEVLAGTLGWGPELDAVTLRQIGRLAETSLLPPAPAISDAVRALLGASEALVVREAAVAAGRLQDHAAFEALVELLDHPDEAVRDASVWSLRRMTGQTFSAEPDRWRTWLWMEQRWLEYTAPMLIDDLDHGDPARAVRALNELSRRRYRRDTLAVEVAVALRDPRPEIRRLACTALGRLRSLACLGELVLALDDPDEDVAEEAWASLRSLTGRNLPPDPQVWSVLCAPGGQASPRREW